VAEAGFFPGIVLYLTYWIPSKRRAGVLAAFLTATAVSGIIGNPLAGALMKMDGLLHLGGWQWWFLLEGIAPVRLGAATLLLALGIWGSLGPFWAISTRFLRGKSAAGGIAIVNSIGALAGFVAPFVIGWVKERTGGFNGLLVVSAALVCGAGLVLLVPHAVD